MQEKYLKVSAGVRYWEDTVLNGVEDIDGLIPCRNNSNWEPIIDLSKGIIINWENGNTAKIHYKVCDDGEYFLLDENKNEIAKWKGYYVPDDLLANGSGYGDYIIMEIEENGKIKNFNYIIDDEQWKKLI